MPVQSDIAIALQRLIPMVKGIERHESVMKEIYHTLSQLHEKTGDLETALYFYREYAKFERTELIGTTAEINSTQMDLNHAPGVFTEYTKNETEKILSAIIEMQEQERKKIAREIYDDMGQMISSIKLQLPSLAKQETSTDKSNALNDLIELLNKVFKEVQPLTDGLYPLTLETLGLSNVLEEMCRKASSDGLQINFYGDTGDCIFPAWLQLTLYRISLELIYNIKKHSRAKEATLQLICHDEYMILIGEDNGIGFDTAILDKLKPGSGLFNTKIRTQMLHGTFSVDSRPGSGTIVSIEIPLKFS